MPTYRYEGDEERYYSDLGVLAKPGKTYDLPDAPDDGRWAKAAKQKENG